MHKLRNVVAKAPRHAHDAVREESLLEHGIVPSNLLENRGELKFHAPTLIALLNSASCWHASFSELLSTILKGGPALRQCAKSCGAWNSWKVFRREGKADPVG